MADPIDAAAAAAASHGLSPIELFSQSDTIVKSVMIILILASAWGWAVIFDKLIRLHLLQKRADKLIASIQAGLPIASVAESFQQAAGTDPFVTVYKAMVEEHSRSAELTQSEGQRDSLQERVHRVGQLASINALDHLQSRLPGLATIGAVAPFVGLFGTVWGIMTSFQGIAASNNTSLAVVAPGIAEALFATALGLVAAIPAVVFYNRIGADIGRYGKRLNAFIGVFEVELSRQLSKKGDRNGLRAA
ncbi:MotA/TolQ/ExbB proton channel [Methylocella silvestris BL2]|uniref:MotA/TolQ/ExbB proton channel n=1 Tax=Methylocella silvestris (strain DSM 15510 / CIP 108128 / LMG 27833 / NCIMB 13906 / BL2) TaxID=395965 RepID=B8EMB8_METSB|nr:MotA/TolQ/ExbB proton channel family protein [Methylocella silvestris]ACK52046.1 MotA/TolQ/ExbB proton channel [Methylocella silvestris BL2]